MTNKELENLSFETSVQKMLIATTAMLRVVLYNQKIILKALNVVDENTIVQEMNDKLEENIKTVEEALNILAPKSVKSIFPKLN